VAQERAQPSSAELNEGVSAVAVQAEIARLRRTESAHRVFKKEEGRKEGGRRPHVNQVDLGAGDGDQIFL